MTREVLAPWSKIQKDLNLSRALTGSLTDFWRKEVRNSNGEQFYTYLEVISKGPRCWNTSLRKHVTGVSRESYSDTRPVVDTMSEGLYNSWGKCSKFGEDVAMWKMQEVRRVRLEWRVEDGRRV